MGRCKLECPDGEVERCICCTKQDSCQCRCDDMTVMNMRRNAKNMRLIDLLAAIGSDTDTKSNIKIQICHPERNRKSYDTLNADSKLLEPFYDLEIRYLSAIETNVVRVDLAFDEKEGCD